MENIMIQFTPLQAFVALAFDVWVIVVPLLILRKLNYLTELLQSYLDTDGDASST